MLIHEAALPGNSLDLSKAMPGSRRRQGCHRLVFPVIGPGKNRRKLFQVPLVAGAVVIGAFVDTEMPAALDGLDAFLQAPDMAVEPCIFLCLPAHTMAHTFYIFTQCFIFITL